MRNRWELEGEDVGNLSNSHAHVEAYRGADFSNCKNILLVGGHGLLSSIETLRHHLTPSTILTPNGGGEIRKIRILNRIYHSPTNDQNRHSPVCYLTRLIPRKFKEELNTIWCAALHLHPHLIWNFIGRSVGTSLEPIDFRFFLKSTTQGYDVCFEKQQESHEEGGFLRAGIAFTFRHTGTV